MKIFDEQPEIAEIQHQFRHQISSHQTEPADHSNIESLFLGIEHYTKIIVLVILLIITASCYILGTTLFEVQARKVEIPQTINAPLQDNPIPIISTPQKIQITKFQQYSQSLRSKVEELIQKYKPTIGQLTQLQEKIVDKMKVIQKRIQLQQARGAFFQEKSQFERFSYLALQRYNLNYQSNQMIQAKQKAKDKQYNQMVQNYHIDKTTSEMPICIVVYVSTTKKPNAASYLLNSLQNQNYNNFKVVITFDAGDQSFLNGLKLSLQSSSLKNVSLIKNTERLGFWKSVKSAISSKCNNTQIIGLMKISDQLLGFNVLKLFNSIYQQKEANVVYSNFIEYHSEYKQLFKGYSSKYNEQIKFNYKFRDVPIQFGPFLTFKTKLFKYIKDQDIMVTNNNITPFQMEIAIFYCLLELSCGQIQFVNEYFYLFDGYRFQNNKNTNFEENMQKLQSIQKYKCHRYIEHIQ